MNKPILKRALAQPQEPVGRAAAPGLGMLGYVPKYQPKKPSVRRMREARRGGRDGGAP